MVLDRQYYVPGNIMTIRMRFFDLVRHQLDFSCRVKSYPHLPGAPGEFNYLCLIDYTWGECGDLEFIDLNGDQTQVRFYLPVHASGSGFMRISAGPRRSLRSMQKNCMSIR
jgi:hypothetical protein